MQQLNAALDAGLACQSNRARGWKCLRDHLLDPAQVEVGDLAERVERGPHPPLDPPLCHGKTLCAPEEPDDRIAVAPGGLGLAQFRAYDGASSEAFRSLVCRILARGEPGLEKEMRVRDLGEGKGYEVVTFPKSRLATLDLGRLYRGKHYMFGLLEVDVTNGRMAARELRSKGQPVSFTAWMIKAIGNAIARNPGVQSIGHGRNRTVLFDSVDIALPVEKSVEGALAPVPLLIRDVDTKTASAIQEEIDVARQRSVADEGDFVLGPRQLSRTSLRLYYALPQWLRLRLMRWLLSDPSRAKRYAGTAIVTTVNAVGRSAGWILPTRNMHSLAVAFGSITKKPWVIDNQVGIREILHLTIVFDHDVVDGMPAQRFTQDLVRHIEKGILGD